MPRKPECIEQIAYSSDANAEYATMRMYTKGHGRNKHANHSAGVISAAVVAMGKQCIGSSETFRESNSQRSIIAPARTPNIHNECGIH